MQITWGLIDLQDNERGKATRVWALDEDELEMDLYEDRDEEQFEDDPRFSRGIILQHG